MAKLKINIRTFVSLFTGMRKLLVFFSVVFIALILLWLKQVTGEVTIISIKEIGIAYVTANVFTKCIDMGKQWIKKKKK